MRKKFIFTKQPKLLTKTICPLLKSRLFWHFLKFFATALGKRWFKTKVSCSSKKNWEHVFFRKTLEQNFESLLLYFCSTERNSECFLFRRMFRMEFREFASFCCSTVRNSEHFSAHYHTVYCTIPSRRKLLLKKGNSQIARQLLPHFI